MFLCRYVVGENRVIFMLKDGAMAWEVKDFLVNQDRCEEVTIEGKSYPGKVRIVFLHHEINLSKIITCSV